MINPFQVALTSLSLQASSLLRRKDSLEWAFCVLSDFTWTYSSMEESTNNKLDKLRKLNGRID